MIPFNQLFKFVIETCAKHNIDDSHGLKHSMDVLNYSQKIYNEEKKINNLIHDYPYEKIIFTSAILHDMCDKKYMKEEEGLHSMELFLKDKIKISDEERNVVSSIINTMSYSKVKVNGFPNLGIYQSAYHIVREADLLSAYDFDRCLIYGLNVRGENFENTFTRAEELFKNRVLRHAEDNLFTTEYAKTCYPALHLQAINRISSWKRILHISS